MYRHHWRASASRLKRQALVRVAEEVAERDFAVYSLTRRNAWKANKKAEYCLGRARDSRLGGRRSSMSAVMVLADRRIPWGAWAVVHADVSRDTAHPLSNSILNETNST